MSQPEIIIASDEDARRAIEGTKICKRLGRVLLGHYPKRKWYVDVRLEAGMAYICCPDISMRYGFYLKLNRPMEEMERETVKAGGEILERFKLSRERGARGGEELLKRNAMGEAVAAAAGGL